MCVCVCVCVVSHVRLFITPLTVAHQAPLSEISQARMGRTNNASMEWSGLLFSAPRDLPDLGIDPQSSSPLCHLGPLQRFNGF